MPSMLFHLCKWCNACCIQQRSMHRWSICFFVMNLCTPCWEASHHSVTGVIWRCRCCRVLWWCGSTWTDELTGCNTWSNQRRSPTGCLRNLTPDNPQPICPKRCWVYLSVKDAMTDLSHWSSYSLFLCLWVKKMQLLWDLQTLRQVMQASFVFRESIKSARPVLTPKWNNQNVSRNYFIY